MNVFVTGITGTLGRAVTDSLLLDPSIHVFGYSRDEKKQSDIPKHPRLMLILGDVRDRRRVIESSRKCDLILHFAALKRVDTLELNPEESIETNIEGTRNILGAQRQNEIPRVVLSSTDKACKPINVYGYCKALSEKLVLRNKNNVVVRYGNVLASRGSAVIDFIKSIQTKSEVNITDPRMTRFFIKIDDAADFVIQSAFAQEGGLKILSSMKSCHMKDIVEVLGEILDKKVKTNICGMRPGEKLHEDLFHEYERATALSSLTAAKFTNEELRALLIPIALRLTRKKSKILQSMNGAELAI